MTMTKADLVETVAEAADVPRKQADEVVQVILESIILSVPQFSLFRYFIIQTFQVIFS